MLEVCKQKEIDWSIPIDWSVIIDEHELAIAQDTGAGQGEIIVDLQMDNEAARRQKQQEAEEKRQQNMLPVWHQRSTVSDALVSSSEVVEEKKNEDEDEMFEEVAQEEFDADRHDCKYPIYTLHDTGCSLCLLDYAKYYESLSQAVPPTLDTSDVEEEPEFEAVENTEASNMMEER